MLYRRLLATPLLLPFALTRFFGERVTWESAGESLKRSLAERDARFLAVARTEIYGRPRSISAKLLAFAGCGYADLETLVRNVGLDAGLMELAGAGVYLTEDEFKGRAPVVRGGRTLAPPRADETAPHTPLGLVAHSSGTSGRMAPCVYSLDWIAREGWATVAFVRAHALDACVHAAYEPVLPGTGGIKFMLHLARHGIAFDRWFARTLPVEGRLVRAYHGLVARELALMGTWYGPGFAAPERLPAHDLSRVVAWIRDERRQGRRCCLRTVVSSGARIARTAKEMGVSLEGTTFVLSGEPLTEARRAAISKTGAEVVPVYGYVPGGLVGMGCGRPQAIDDMHVLRHLLAVVPQPEERTDGTRPLLFTTLYPSAPCLLLNVANGDRAHLVTRACGCPLGEAGLTLHVTDVGSDEKLTSEGVSYSVADLDRLLEVTLPAGFGGGVGDYQLVEDDGQDGRTHLTLFVHPHVGALDEDRLLFRLREGLAAGSRWNRFMARTWDEAGILRIKRQPPIASPRGKVPPVKTLRRSRPPGD